MKTAILVAFIAALYLIGANADAAPSPELQALRAEYAALKKADQQRKEAQQIDALRAKIKKLRDRARKTETEEQP